MAITEKYAACSVADGAVGADGSIGNPWSWSDAFNIGASTAGFRINIKLDANVTTAGADTQLAVGTTTSPIIFRPYLNTIGDLCMGGASYSRLVSGTGALNTSGLPTITYPDTTSLTLKTLTIFDGICVITGNVSTGVVICGSQNKAQSLVVTNASTNAAAACIVYGTGGVVRDCDLTLIGASGGNACLVGTSNGVAGKILYNRIRGGPGGGVFAGGAAVIKGNVIFRCGTDGIFTTSTAASITAVENTIAFCTGDAIDLITGNAAIQEIASNMITDNGGYGINANNAAAVASSSRNRYRNNTLGNYNLGTDWLAATDMFDITTGTASDYVDAANDDYRLRSTSPGIGAGPGGSDLGAGKGNVGARGSMGLGL